ncbi:unnamed protein product [Amoebophrya sp. A120]|nr:unnamed protein product [Amoebophrya sp. A120]|eukprot:GSA120T00008515001.1
MVFGMFASAEDPPAPAADTSEMLEENLEENDNALAHAPVASKKPGGIGKNKKSAGAEGETTGVELAAVTIDSPAASKDDNFDRPPPPARKTTEMWTGEDPNTLNLNMMKSENLPEWFTSGLEQFDKDGDGELHKDEIMHWVNVILRMRQKKEANAPDIDYSEFPQQVKDVMARWDVDQNGLITVSELAAAGQAQEKMEKENRYMKIAIAGLVGVIVLLTVLMFAMGYAAAEASKDYRPASADHGRRRALTEATLASEQSVYGERLRLLHAEGDDSSTLKNPPGTFMEEDLTMSTAMCTNVLTGMGEVMEILTTINPKSAGRLQTLTVPTSQGQKVIQFSGVTVSDRQSLTEGSIREFSQEGGGPKIRLVAPPMPMYNATDPCFVYPERRMEFVDGQSGNIDVVTEYFLSHNGCPPVTGPPLPNGNPACAPPTPLFNGSMPDRAACVATVPTLVVQCEAQKPNPVGMGTMPALHTYCVNGMCNLGNFTIFYNVMPNKPLGQTAETVFLLWDTNNDTIVDEMEINRGQGQAAPDFQHAQQSLMTTSQTVQNYVTHALVHGNTTTRRRMLEAQLIAGTFETERRLSEDGQTERTLMAKPSWWTAGDPRRITDIATKICMVSNSHCANSVEADRLAEALCEGNEALCETAPAMTRSLDRDGDGRVNEREYEAIHEKARPDPDARNRRDVEEPRPDSDVCPNFNTPDIGDGIDCGSEEDLGKLKDMADKRSWCSKAAGRDGILDNEECKNANRVPTAFDTMAEMQAQGDVRMKSMIENSGVGLPACKQFYMREKALDDPVAEVICHIRDFEYPFMDESSGLSAKEANLDMGLLLERYGSEGASASTTVRKLQQELGFGKRTRDKFGNIITQESALARQGTDVQDDPLHYHVFEKLINTPRARRMEQKIINKERKLRQKRRMLHGSNSEMYESWLLARRLKATEKLRRRRVLLAFDEEKDDPEVTHRKLQSINRRLEQISEAKNSGEAASSLRRLEQTGRRLLAEDDDGDRKLRFLLDDDNHLITRNLQQYQQEFKIGSTSRHMRELMTLTHAGKRNLISLEQIGEKVMNYIITDDVDGLQTWAMTMLRSDIRISIPKQAILYLLYDARDPLGIGMGVARYLDQFMSDNQAEEMREETGRMPESQDFSRYDRDGETLADVRPRMRQLSHQRRVLVEIAERRRMRALQEKDGNQRRKLLEETDSIHRRLHEVARHDPDETRVLNSEEIRQMSEQTPLNERETERVIEHCRRENRDLEGAQARQFTRLLKQLDLSDSERRELRDAAEDAGMSSDRDEEPVACTPCALATAPTVGMTPDHLRDAVLNNNERQEGNPDWCATQFQDMQAMAVNVPTCLGASQNATTGEYMTPIATYPADQPVTLPRVPEAYTGAIAAANTAPTTGNLMAAGSVTPQAGDVIDPYTCAGAKPPAQPGAAAAIPDTQFPTYAQAGGTRRSLRTFDQSDLVLTTKPRNLSKQHVNKHKRPKGRSLTANVSPSLDLFAHKSKPMSYAKQLQREQEVEMRRVRRERRLLEEHMQIGNDEPGTASLSRNPEAEILYDGNGRKLMPALSQTICQSANIPDSEYLCCHTGICITEHANPTQMENPDRDITQGGEPMARMDPEPPAPVTFSQFVDRMMHELPSCKKLPPEERQMPLDAATQNFDLDHDHTLAFNMEVDKMGPGCVKECGCHYLGLHPNTGEDVLVNICNYQAEVRCGCMKNKKHCFDEIMRTWEEKGGTRDERGNNRRARMQRRERRRRNLRESRLQSGNFRRLTKFDVKKVHHKVEMQKDHRAHLLRRVLQENDVEKIESFEKEFHLGFGKRHKSFRVLTGKTGDRFRQLAVVDHFHRRLRRQRRMLSTSQTTGVHETALGYHNMGTAVATGVVAMANPATSPPPTTGPPSYIESAVTTAWLPDTTTPLPPRPATITETATTPPALVTPISGNRTTPITVKAVIDQSFFDSRDGMFKQLLYMDVNRREPPPRNITADPYDTVICATFEQNANTHAPLTECMNAMPWDPDVMGYHPQFFDDYHAGTVHCPTGNDNDWSGTAYATAMANFDGNRNGDDIDFLQNTPEGYTCFEGMMVPDYTVKEHEDEMSSRKTSGQVLHEVCKPQQNPFGPELKMELENFAYEHFTEIDACPDCCEGFPTLGDLMLHEVQLAFPEPGVFHNRELKQPALRRQFDALEARVGTSPNVQERAHNSVMEKEFGAHSIIEAVTFGIASGDIAPLIEKAMDKSGDIFDSIKNYASRDPSSDELTFGEIKAYYEDCQKSQRPPGLSSEVCELLNKMIDILEQKILPPASAGRDAIPATASISRMEIMNVVDQTIPGNEPGMPMGERMGAGDYFCSQMMDGESGCIERACIEQTFFDQSNNQATVPRDALYEPATEAREIKSDSRPMLDSDREEKQERMDSNERDITTSQMKDRAFAEGESCGASICERMQARRRRRLLRRARELQADEKRVLSEKKEKNAVVGGMEGAARGLNEIAVSSLQAHLQTALQEEIDFLKDFFPEEEHARRLTAITFERAGNKATGLGHFLRNDTNLDGGVDPQTGMKVGSLLTDRPCGELHQCGSQCWRLPQRRRFVRNRGSGYGVGRG